MTSREDSPLLTATDCPEIIKSDDEVEAVGVIFSRWQSFTGILFYVSVVGTTYAFGVYSNLLKENLGFSQEDIDIVASVGNTGLYMSLFAGLILENFGLKILIWLGGFLIFSGFLYIFLAVQLLVPTTVLSICIVFFFSQFGVCCHVASAVTYSVRLFPIESRGAAVGLAKGYYGISSAVLGDFAGGYFIDAKSYFILFIALVIPSISCYGCSVANLLPSHMVSFEFERSRGIGTTLVPFFCHCGTLFAIIFGVGYAEFAYSLSEYVMFPLSTMLALVVLCINILPSFYGSRTVVNKVAELMEEDDEKMLSDDAYVSRKISQFNAESRMAKGSRDQSLDGAKEDGLDSDEIHGGKEEGPPGESIGHAESLVQPAHDCFYGDSMPLLESVQTWRFWVMYGMFLTLTGTGLMVIDNVDAIAEALGETPSTFFVTLVSLANGLGRVTAGFGSDMMLPYFSKLQLLSFVALLMSLAQMMFAIGAPSLLYPCLLLVGFLFGCAVSLNAVTIADLFGAKHIATNFGAIDSAPIFGSYIFVTGIVALFYTDNTTDDAGGSSCVGASCFRSAFIINSLSCFVMASLCYVMHMYTPMKFVNSGGGH